MNRTSTKRNPVYPDNNDDESTNRDFSYRTNFYQRLKHLNNDIKMFQNKSKSVKIKAVRKVPIVVDYQNETTLQRKKRVAFQ